MNRVTLFAFAVLIASSAHADYFQCRSLNSPDLNGETLVAMEVSTNEATNMGDIVLVTSGRSISFPENDLSFEEIDGARALFATGDKISLALELVAPYRAVLNPVIINGQAYQNLPFSCEKKR